MNCSICLDNIEHVQRKTLICEHTFHLNCIQQCQDGKCPVCREPIFYITKACENDIANLIHIVENSDEAYHNFINNHTFSDYFLQKYHKYIDMNSYLSNTYNTYDLTNIMELLKNELDWDELSSTVEFSIKQLKQFKHYINWPIYFVNHLYLIRDFPFDLLCEIKDWDLDWDLLSSILVFENNELYELEEYINFDIYFQNPYINFNKIPCQLLKNIQNNVDWTPVMQRHNMNKHQTKLITKFLEKK